MEKKSSIIAIGLTVHNAPVELREKLAVPEAEWQRAIEELCSYPHIEEAAVLSTCNRMEIYVVAVSFHRGAWQRLGSRREAGLVADAGGWLTGRGVKLGWLVPLLPPCRCSCCRAAAAAHPAARSLPRPPTRRAGGGGLDEPRLGRGPGGAAAAPVPAARP